MRIIFKSSRNAITFWVIIAAMSIFITLRVDAADYYPPGPDRFIIVSQEYTAYEWWLTDWSDNETVCVINIDHDDVPTNGEIYSTCGKTIFDNWLKTRPCESSELNPNTCSGYYLVLHESKLSHRDIGKMLPAPVVWVTLDGCIPFRSTFKCESLPVLILSGEEPLDGQYITSLSGSIEGSPFECDPICQVDLPPTDTDGLTMEFWANSSYGDSSDLFKAQVRVTTSDDPDDHSWYIDILSSQWRGEPLAGCSQIWNVFPPIGGVPAWLSTPQRPEELATNIPYEYLSSNLLKQGIVDGSLCLDGGLLDNGMASVCGLEIARSSVNDWQNRFDDLIFNASREIGIPAQILKNIFSRESQFWPGVIPGHPEVGLGQMTEDGADAMLFWNQPYYEQFCPSILDNTTCHQPYSQLTIPQQDTLRTSLVNSVNAFCLDCPLGIDLNQAEQSVSIFAEMLLANCMQTGMVMDLNDGTNAKIEISYEDYWKFTLVNYNAGPGCLGLALETTRNKAESLDWDHVSQHLTPACSGAYEYVNNISSFPIP
jgi:hypothetical protein